MHILLYEQAVCKASPKMEKGLFDDTGGRQYVFLLFHLKGRKQSLNFSKEKAKKGSRMGFWTLM